MLFFRRRDTLRQSHLTDQERCVHAFLFFASILVILTAVLFYFAATNKGSAEQAVYYYLGAGICFIFLLIISVGAILFIRRLYGSPETIDSQQTVPTDTDYTSVRLSNHHV